MDRVRTPRVYQRLRPEAGAELRVKFVCFQPSIEFKHGLVNLQFMAYIWGKSKPWTAITSFHGLRWGEK
jgi:hypothetical protein